MAQLFLLSIKDLLRSFLIVKFQPPRRRGVTVEMSVLEILTHDCMSLETEKGRRKSGINHVEVDILIMDFLSINTQLVYVDAFIILHHRVTVTGGSIAKNG